MSDPLTFESIIEGIENTNTPVLVINTDMQPIIPETARFGVTAPRATQAAQLLQSLMMDELGRINEARQAERLPLVELVGPLKPAATDPLFTALRRAVTAASRESDFNTQPEFIVGQQVRLVNIGAMIDNGQLPSYVEEGASGTLGRQDTYGDGTVVWRVRLNEQGGTYYLPPENIEPE